MSVSYLRTIVGSGSRPINSAWGGRGQHAQANRGHVVETTVHAVFPPGEALRRVLPGDRQKDHQGIHDDSAPLAKESAALVSAPGENATPDEHPSQTPQDTVMVKSFSLPGLPAPTVQDITRSSRPVEQVSEIPDHRGAVSLAGQQANQVAPHAEDGRAGRTDTGPIADVSSVLREAPGKGGRAEGKGRNGREMPADVIPPVPQQQAGLGVQEAVQRGPAQSGLSVPDSAIPQRPAVSDARSSLPEGTTRSLQPRGAVRNAHTDLAVFYVTPRDSTPEAATGPGAHPPDADKGSNMPVATPRSLMPQGAARDPRTDLKVFYATPRDSAPEAATEPGTHPPDADKGSNMPAATPRSPLPQDFVRNTRRDLRVFYATPQQAAPEAAAMPATPTEADSGNAARPALLSTALSSQEQPKAQVILPLAEAGADNAAQQTTPAVAGASRTAAAGERESIPGRASAAKPQSVPPVLVREATPEQPSREPEPLAVRPRGQDPLSPTAAAQSHRDENGPRLLIHRLDVQIVTQKQPEPPPQRAQPRPAAAPRDAWEGVDRHYLHHVSVSA